ncbi:MAG: type II CRISPR RNA-guided endonuclease Cas9 [Chitinophagia bacterium]
MKKIIGLDLGTTSIGWAFVKEGENNDSEIVKIGVRVNPLTTDEQTDFEKSKSVSSNADRTLKRGARRNLDRYKQRRDNLISLLIEKKLLSEKTILAETEKSSTHSTYYIRSKAATEKLSIDEFVRVLLMINKKRGYKSSRKAKNEDEGQVIDGMAVAKILYEENQTPGEYCYQILKSGKKYLPEFYRSDLKREFEKVWKTQNIFYPDILTEEIRKELNEKGQKATIAIFLSKTNIYTAENKTGTRDERKLKLYEWRKKAISDKLKIEEVVSVIAEINNNINNSSGYLGAISDRSKELFFNKVTIGQYLYHQLKNNPHTRTKGQVFYRQDYLDEFETIWETQAKFHKELTPELKIEVRDIIIFYQRRLKSQKGLISFCEFENKQIEVVEDGKKKIKIVGYRVSPKSSPLFQEFKIWQNLNNLEAQNKKTKNIIKFEFEPELKQQLFAELNIKGNLTKEQALTVLGLKTTDWELNFNEVEGNRTNKDLYGIFEKILQFEGNEDIDFVNMPAKEIKCLVTDLFKSLKIDTSILEFDAELAGKLLEKQSSFQLWHLLYSYEGDNSNTGNNKLVEQLQNKYGFKKEYAQLLSNVNFSEDYGNLSAKAMRKIFTYIKENKYNTACGLAGYNHSSSKTKEENESRILKDNLEILPKNSLRNPIVEKILNQMINVVNAIIAEPELGKPDEIRIELARELKKNAKERAEMTSSINQAKLLHENIFKLLQNEFGIKNPTRNDIIRYKLYDELKSNGYKTLYSDTYIPREKLFSKEFDIEHIIPKARLFDDSFSNKTIAPRQENINKKDETAFDFVDNSLGKEALESYVARVEMMFKLKEGGINKAKYKKLLMKGTEIGKGFIERDLRDSQYIAKKAKELLEEICRTVSSTTGSITDRLREDWDLINVMQELNFDKYKNLGLIEIIEKKDGNTKGRIVDWTKRNDHRHHAMDALTVAFTKSSHVQYLNNLNARSDKASSIYGIEQKETFKDPEGKRKFKMPLNNFREEAKKHLENVLVSFKAKNKVVTKNKNKIKTKSGERVKYELTPRGQLHKETVYGKLKQYTTREVKVGANFNEETILKTAKYSEREALLLRLKENDNDPKKAFTGKNSLSKTPVYIDRQKSIPIGEKVKLVEFEDDYTIRKEISPDLKIEKIIDGGIKRILQKRLDEFNGSNKEAFSNLDKNPIWLNEERGIAIKRVTISGVKNVEALHTKKDHFGNDILDENGNKIPVDFVSTGNNHHVAIYQDSNEDFQEKIVSLYEAVERVNQRLPIIDKLFNQHIGWQFLFTMKQNEYFVFPTEEFDPKEIDLLNPENNKLISKYLYRVQKIATKNYFFRHHLETTVEEKKELKNISYKPQLGLNAIKGIVKVRINHIGQIVKIGEY